MIKCKRCFKKYDGHDPECPRCGRINEYEDDYSISHSKDNVQTENSKSWFKNVKCEVCGKSSLSNVNNCPSCFNSNIQSKSMKTSQVDSSRVNSLVDDLIKKANGKVDMLELFHEAELINLDINTWESPYAFEYGKKITFKSMLFMFGSFTFFSFFKMFDSVSDALPMILFTAVVGIIVLLVRKKNCVTGIRISKLKSHEESAITYFKENKGKRGEDVFKIWSYDLDYIELGIKNRDELHTIRFKEKLDETGQQQTHQVYPEEFTETHDFIKVLVFFCFKYNVDLQIREEAVTETLREDIN